MPNALSAYSDMMDEMLETQKEQLEKMKHIRIQGAEGSIWGALVGSLLDRGHTPEEIGEFAKNLSIMTAASVSSQETSLPHESQPS
jgi:hypothetical protein